MNCGILLQKISLVFNFLPLLQLVLLAGRGGPSLTVEIINLALAIARTRLNIGIEVNVLIAFSINYNLINMPPNEQGSCRK